MNFELFLGRFHPLVVHLPIGFLLLAAIMEVLSRFFTEKYKGLDLAISISILCGCFGAVASIVIGLLLAGGGGYDEQTLFWHKWMGITLAVVAFAGWAVKVGYIKLSTKVTSAIIGLLVVLVSITGHLGGNLTHGSDYLLVYAPKFVQQIAGVNADGGIDKKDIPAHPDSLIVFKHLVQPALINKCSGCHNETKTKGGLLITTKEGIEKGGENGEVVLPGKAHESELFVRVTLPQSSKKFMPPKGEPLTYSELKIMEWWMASGASYEASLSANEVPREIQTLLLRDYGVDTKAKPHYEMIEVPVVSNDELKQMSEAGLMVKPLSSGHHFLQVKPATGKVSQDQIDALLLAKEQITWLDLSSSELSDNMLSAVGQLANLTKLKLNNNPITDAGLAELKKLKYLEVLNLYDTQITDESISTLKQMVSLKRVYLWQTNMTNKGAERLKNELKGVTVYMGVESIGSNT
ncbi:c-type cytochrome domain-containing protein [Reichenbachiella sp. MALMAid0571]|uniref:c-type cytochrome domain-containing protein n=1 Tax=Reichenbachiella sp. MALMAid0571 TaxID=3143939 RepID=UPI0032DE3513